MRLNLLLFYCGPNRRSDNTVIEAALSFNDRDEQFIADGWDTALTTIFDELKAAGIKVPENGFEFPGRADDVLSSFAGLCGRTALVLQNSCGHRVHETGCLLDRERRRCAIVFEHEESRVGEQAGILALGLMEQAFPGLRIDLQDRALDRSFRDAFGAFREFSANLVQAPDTGAIIAAAKRQGVPVIKLERDPYEAVEGDFRIRMNSMLMLGHSSQRQVIDGTFAIEKSARASTLLFKRRDIMQAALQMGMPVPPGTRSNQLLVSARQAQRAAQASGYPVVVKTATRGRPGGTTLDIPDAHGLAAAVVLAQKHEDQFIVEGFIAGHSWKLLVADHQLIAVLPARSTEVFSGPVHDSIAQMAVAASQLLQVGLMTLSIVTPDISQSLSRARGAVVGIDIAPRLDRLLGARCALMEEAADGFVRWLVPAGSASSIPIICVTGTNGKTTTCRMLSHIMQHTGRVTGLVCTDGRYINNQLIEAGDASGLMGHYRVFEDKSVELAVLEAHHRGIAAYGFAFDRCEVAICTNVSDDHLGTLGIQTVSDMAILKRSLLERAKDCALVNADDPECLAMAPFISARRICLSSLDQSAPELARLAEGAFFSCVVEKRDDTDWVIIHDQGQCHDIIPVAGIPATFGGRARFNTSNAMQAIAGSFAMGVAPESIRAAMSSFSMSPENTPGRLNFYRGLPFQVLVDFAHNPDGVRRIAEFTDGIAVTGKKIIAFSGLRSDRTIRRMARHAAGHYDHYLLKKYGRPEGLFTKEQREEGEIEAMMKTILRASGVQEKQISIVPDEMEAVECTLNMAGPGDLVVLLLGYTAMEVIHGFLTEYINNYDA